jgi:hypothetical protein
MGLTTTASLAGETEPPRPICARCGWPIEGLAVRGFSDHRLEHADWVGCPEGPPPSVEGALVAVDALAEAEHASVDALERLADLGHGLTKTAPRSLPPIVHERLGSFEPLVRKLDTGFIRKQIDGDGLKPLAAGPVWPPATGAVRYGSQPKKKVRD